MSGRIVVSLVALLAAGCATVQEVRPQTPTVPTPTCKGVADCDAKWSAARSYLIDHAAYKLENDSADRLETFDPSNEATMGLRASVHREYEPDGSFAIVAKFWCNNLIVCSPNAKEALSDFNRTVEAAMSSEPGIQTAAASPPVVVAKLSPPADVNVNVNADRASNSATPVHSPGVEIDNADVAEIRADRKNYNAALAARNVEVISGYWLPDSQSVWASGKLTVGHDEIVARYAKLFKSDYFVSGLRTPQTVEVTGNGGSDAAEVGVWEWKVRDSGQEITWSGRYLAMWQKVGGRWSLRSDLYVTTGCTGGSACR